MTYSLLMLLLFTSIASAAGDYYPSFKDCAPFTCGNSTIQYPFGPCGLIDVLCFDNQTTLIAHVSNTYWEGGVVGEIAKSSYSTGTLQITPSHINPFDLYFHDPTVSNYASSYDWLSGDNFFNLSDADMLGTIVNCTQPADIHFNDSLIKRVDCTESNSYCFFYPGADIQIPSCYKYAIVVPTNKSYNISADKDFEQLRPRGFQIKWSIHDDTCDSCKASGGRCYLQFYPHFYLTYCICPDNDVHENACNDGYVIQYGKRFSVKFLAAIFIAVCAVFSIVVVCCIMVRRRSCCCQKNSHEQQQSIRAFMDPVHSRPLSVENFLNYYSSQAPARYSYSQIITYTNNLEHKLGKGGFGTVYRGKLPNGHLIAVKILDESKQSEQQFIAEVATVGTTCHINLVRLLGYCSQGCKRALVYEYMINGSLDKYIHGDQKEEIDWKQLFSIAVGTARGIAYLHERLQKSHPAL